MEDNGFHSSCMLLKDGDSDDFTHRSQTTSDTIDVKVFWYDDYHHF